MATPFTVYTGSDNTTLANAILAPASGITIAAGSIVLKASGQEAVNFYDGSLAPLGIGAGLLLTSGTTPGTANTVGWFGTDNSGTSGFINGDANIDAVVNTVFQTQSYDATTLSFDFTVSDPAATSVSFDVVFGSDEFPEWVDQFVDSAIVMVNGVNYALFNHDPAHPLSVVSANLAAGYFQDNAGNSFPIEYDGVSHVLKIVAPIIPGGVTNHIKIGIADTGDHIYDSGIFLANFSAGNIPGSGVVITPPNTGTDNSDNISGSSKDEYFDLKGGDDTCYAGAGDDIVVAGSGNDSVFGGSGADQLKGDAGDDNLDGGIGNDTAVYAGPSTDYTIVAAGGGFTITDSKTGPASEGTDTLTSIEFAKFGNGLFAIVAGGTLTPVSDPGTPPTNTPGSVVISGIASVGKTLTASVSDADGISGGISYQWQVSGDSGATWSNVGTDSHNYTVVGADVGKAIQVIASYVDNGSQAESPVSTAKTIQQVGEGDLIVTLIQLDAPVGASVINPLTTLVQDAIQFGLSPNTAALAVKTVLGLPASVNLQSYDAYAVLQANPTEPIALAVEKVAVEVAILTSLSDDDTGTNLTLKILDAAAANQKLDLADPTDLANILNLDTTQFDINDKQTYPQPLREIFDRHENIAQATTVSAIEVEWQDFLSIQDNVNSTSIADLSIHVNQAPTGIATGSLADGLENTAYIVSAADLLQGFSDPEGNTLSVSGLAADNGVVTENGNGTFTITPALNYNGPVELAYSVVDGLGGAVVASQLFVIVAAAVDHEATGTLNLTGTAAEGGSLIASLTGLSDADGATTTAYQWQENVGGTWTDLNGANTETLNIPADQSYVGKTVRVVATTTDVLGGTTVFEGAGQTVANVDDEATGVLAVAGAAAEGGSLAASLTGVSDADGATTTAYQWQENVGGTWADLNGANTETLNIPADQSYVGNTVRVVATTTDVLGGTTVFEGAGQTIANVDDEATGVLAVAGAAAEGGSLTASLTGVSDADGATITAYQWQENVGGTWTDLNGANTALLSIPADQSYVGKTVRVVATTTDVLGGTTVFEGAGQTITNVDDEATGVLAVAGAAAEGGSLAASLTGVSDIDGATTTAYQWQENVAGTWTDLSGANTETLNIPADQSYVGKTVRVVATTTDALGGTTAFEGAGQTIVNVDDEASGTMNFAGNAAEGASLSASLTAVSDADGATTTAYRWQENLAGVWSDINGANTDTLNIPSDQSFVGKAVRVVATTTDVLGGTTTFEGAGQTIANVNDAPTGAVTISGTATKGQTLSAANTLADADGMGTVGYQWAADGVNINGATSSSYTLTQSEVGKIISVTASYTDAFGTFESVASSPTGMVTEPAGVTRVGTPGADILNGSAGDDVLSGLGGKDTLNGFAGNDTLNGGAGGDVMAGGAGDDTYYVDSFNDVVTESANAGADTVISGLFAYVLDGNVENLMLGSGAFVGIGNGLDNKLIGNANGNILSGLGGNDTVAGGAGSDLLFGNDGNDVVEGGAGSDFLFGDAGNDAIDGGAGNDVLSGGAGKDALSGSLGADIFRFDTALSAINNLDSILDFVSSDDTIVLDNAIFTKLTKTGTLSAANFRASADGVAADANDYVLYDTDSGVVSYDADGSGMGEAVAVVTLIGVPTLTAADFLIV